MKKYLLLTALVLATTAQADFWDNCTAYGGTIITANSYGNDKGGDCNDPNDTTKTNNCNGMRFCMGSKGMNWWSAFTWCEAIGGKLASFSSACPGTQNYSSYTTRVCGNVIKIIDGDHMPTWVNIGPSTTNGHLIKLFVAPTYFIIDISFLLACTVNLIVFAIINTEMIISKIRIPPDTHLIPLATLIKA